MFRGDRHRGAVRVVFAIVVALALSSPALAAKAHAKPKPKPNKAHTLAATKDKPGKPQPPDRPHHVRVTDVTTTTATVTWTAPRDGSAVAYALFLDDKRVATTTKLTYTFTGLSCGREYEIGVASVGSNGLVSDVKHREVHTDKCAGKDTTPPTVSISAPAANAAVHNGVAVTANAADSGSGVATVTFRYCPGTTCSFSTGTAIGTATSSPWTVSWAGQPADGGYAIVARAADVAGNTADSASVPVVIDNTAPDTTLSSGPAAKTNSQSATFSFTSEPGATFQCSLDGGAYAACTSPKSYSSLAAGTHTFGVRAVDAAGNVDPTPSTQSWLIDLTAPTTSITCNGGSCGGVFNVGVTVALTAVDGGGAGVAQIRYTTDGTDPTPTNGLVYLAPFMLMSTTNLRYRAFDTVGNAEAVHAQTITIDTAPPDTTISSAPPATTNSTSATFAFTSEPGATFLCSLDGAALASCTSPKTYSGLADGAHTFSVRATDTAGNTDPTPATYSWRIDSTAPDTTLTSTPPTLSSSRTADFSFTSEAGATFQCSLDAAAYASCASPASYSGLADGSHTFSVRATDAAGNTDATPATFTWTIDATAPDTTITGEPSFLSNNASPTFTFTSETGAAFQCALDGGAFVDCSSPKTYSGLADGSHTFSVRATDAAGNTDPTAAAYSWTIDTTAPTVTITGGPSGLTTATSAEFTFSSEAGAAFQCALDGGAYSDCASPKTYSGLADGSHTFSVRATDPAGNAGQASTRAWAVDSTPPDTTIASGPNGLVSTGSATFTFSSEAGAAFQCSLDGGAYTDCASPKTYSGLGDGSHTFSVRAVDAAGNADPTPAGRSWTVDTTPPSTTIASGPGSLVNASSATFTFSSEAGATFRCSIDGAAFADCASPKTYTGLADGGHTFTVRAVDAAGNVDPTPPTMSWTIDTSAPETTITSSPTGTVSTRTATIAFTSEPNARFECSLDSSPFADCSSPKSYSGLADGSHTFSVRATDTAGNTDATPAAATWTIDATPPDTTITSQPSSVSRDSSPSFSFSSEAGATFQCSLDGGVFVDCSSPKSYSGLADGSHTFAVRATDTAGNVDPTPATYSWAIDATPPETTIDTHPKTLSNDPSPSFSFSSEAGASFQCSLDGGAFADCASPKSYSGLADGSHTFAVRATDAAGNSDPTPASFTWTVDTSAPTATIDSGPSGTTNHSDASFTFSSEAGASFQCALDGGSYGDCASPKNYSGLADGSHTFSVRATDAAGNTGQAASRTWTIDTTAPDTILVSSPSGTTNHNDATLTFTSEAGASFQCSLDGSAYADCASPKSYSGLADGSHTFAVRASDAAGNTDATPATAFWTIDTTAPETTLDSHPKALSNEANASFSFSSEAGASFQCSLDGGAYSDCASPKSYSGLADGSHTFSVRATDAAGNSDATPASFTWTVDTSAPTATIDSGPSGTTNHADASFTFSSEAGASFQCALDSGPYGDCASPQGYSGLADGSHTFSVRATDAAGNTGPAASRTWTIDTTAPDTILVSSPSGTTNHNDTSLTFTSEAGATFQCALDGSAYADCASPKSYSNLADGSHTFSVRASDAAGNTDATPATANWTIDTTAPDTTIDSGPSGTTNHGDASFTFSSEAGATFQCALDGGAYSDCASPKSYSGLADGSHTFSVRATDAAGNTDASPATATWVIDTTAPDTILVSSPSGTTNHNDASFSFSSEAGASFQCSLDGAPYSDCASPKSYSGLADGSHTFAVRASDGAGNTDATPATANWTIDTTAPETTLDSHPKTLSNEAAASFAFSSEAGASFQCALDGGAFSDCSSPKDYSGLADGSHTFAVRATDAAGNTDPTPASFTWTVDTSAPTATIDSGPTGTTNHSDASFTFSSEAGASFQCSLNGSPFADCTSPQSYSGLTDGSHTFSVRATDAAGNTGQAASRTWSIDTTAPDTILVSSPSGTTNHNDASFSFSSEAGASFQCSLDGGAFSDCASPKSYSGLADGSHTFAVRATDAAGNTDPTPASFTWTIDTSAPTATIDSGPTGTTNHSDASFTFSSEAGATFECALDSGTFDSCTSPKSYTGLADGSHTFSVRATDAAGNTGQAASRTWSIDTTAPDTILVSSPSGTTNHNDATLTFTSEPGASFQCALDGAPYSDCASPKSYTGLADGSHTFSVRATDAAGNTDATPATAFWTIDTTAPETTIDSAPTGTTNHSDASFTFSSEPGASFQCSLDGGAYSDCSSPKSYSGLADGSHTFSVRATDAAGNTDASAASATWVVDTTAPDTVLVSSPSGTTNHNDAALTFTSEAGASFQCSLDGGAYSDCSSPKDYSGLADGSHTFSVRATDAAGNTDATPATANWTIDTTAPETTLDSHPKALSNDPSASFTFSSEAGATFECSLDGGAFADCASPKSYSGLADGSHTFAVRATDAAGNTDPTPASFTWTVDTSAPTATIDSGPSGTTNHSDASFTFSSEAGASFQCALDGGAFSDCGSPRDYNGLADGSHTFSVRATDPAANTGQPASRTWTIDTTAPDTVLVSSPSGTSNHNDATLTFTSETGATFECALDGATYESCTSPKSYSGLADGSHTFSVRASDAAGNTDATPATANWAIDTTAPETTLDSAPTGTTNHSDASFTFSSEAGASFQCALDGSAYSDCSSPKDYSALADGSHTFAVRATDAAGNTDATPATAQWTIDATPPDTSITSEPTFLSNDRSPTFAFTSEPGATFQCSLDSGSYADCSSPTTFSSVGDGPHTFSVRATDAAGNTDPTPAAYSWTVDATAPDTSIDSAPHALSSDSSPTFAFSSEAGATFECALDGAAFESCTSPKQYTAVADGAHTFTVRATDSAGNTDSTPASFSWTVDTSAPDATITDGPTGTTNDSAPSFSFTSEAGASFQCSLDGGAFADCTSPKSYTGLADGSHTFSVRATDAAGNTGPAASRTWSIDTTAPDTVLVSSPSGTTNHNDTSFTFTSETGATFQCALDSGPYGDCASPKSYSGLADGSHTFSVRATDAAGNTDATPATANWTIDTSAPTVTIDSGPTGTTNHNDASFTFSSEPGATFQCALDSGPYGDCASPKDYSGLADGSHTFAVRATDAAGNTSQEATRAWTIDTTAPDTTISDGPTGTTNHADASFSFSSEAGASFQCSLDGGAYSDCSSPKSYSNLADGSHTFSVRATDAAGNTGQAASRTWTIDTTAPTATIDSGPSGTTNHSDASFTFSAEAGATFQCALDGGAYSDCTSPKDYSNLADGSHTFTVRATDAAGNTGPDASRTWTIDTTAPTATIDSGPTGTTNHGDASFTFSSESGATFECALDSGTFESCTSPKDYSGMADGSHTFSVRATDAAGNTGQAASRTWTIDTTAPTATIDSGPSGTTNHSDASFTFSAEAGATFQCALDGGAYSDCASPKDYSGLADGSHTFTVRATDAAGNTGPDASRTWTIDTTAPTTTIGDAPTGTTNLTSATFSFTSEAGASFQCALDGGAYSDCTSPKSYSGLADGSHTFTVRATDSAGNTGPDASRTWTIDTTPPALTITDGPSGTTNSSSASFSFTVDSGAVTQCALDAGDFAPCSSPRSYSSLADGSHTFTVHATDAAGNTSSASRTWTIDTTPPTVTITSGPSGTTNSTSASFSFTAGGAATTECALDATGFAACSSPQSYTGLGDGSHTFTIRATDAAGNAATSSRTWTIDTAPPVVTITAGPSGTVNSGSASFSFTADADATTSCSIDAAAFAACTSPAAYTSLGDGGHTFTVRAVDGAGNAASATRSWTVDTTPPDTQLTSTPDNPSTLSAASFSFSSAETGATFQCSLDSGSFDACTSPKSYSGLADGSHTFAVRAVDAAGNADPTPATFTWSISSTPPDTTITGAPSAFTQATGATLTLSSTQTPSTFRCALDTTTFTTCTSPVTLTGLAQGSHTFQAKAVNGGGLADPSPASVTWTVDTTAPTVALTSPSAGTVSGSVAVSANASDAGGIGSVQFTLDGSPLGSPVTASPYEITWNTATATAGGHTLGAVATDRAGNQTSATTVAVTVATQQALSPGLVAVGPGYVDPTMHQIVRTSGDRVYIAAVDDSAFANPNSRTGPAVLRMYRATSTGTPTAFAEADAAHHPRPGASGAINIGGTDARLDSHGLIHVVWLEVSSRTPLNYNTFDTTTDTWTSTSEEITTGLPNTARGFDAFAMAVDGSDVPVAVYVRGTTLYYNSRAGGTWTHEQQFATGSAPTHPSLTFDPSGNLYVTWLDDVSGAASVKYAERLADGTWSSVETVAASDVLNDVTADQGPSIAVTSSGTPYVVYVSSSRGVIGGMQFGVAQVKYRSSTGWIDDSPTVSDNPPTAGLLVHDPQIAAHGNDIYVFLGHDTQIRLGYAFQQQGQPWSSYTPLSATTDGTLDGAASIRQSTFSDPNSNVIDGAFFDEDKLDNQTWQPELYYHAVTPAAPAAPPPPPAADTTPPTVSITSPSDSSTVTGSVTIQASASDNVGVASVQFKVDGTNLGTADTTSPYSASWDTSSLTVGSTHTITAVAVDAAGNSATSTAIQVTIGAAAPPPTRTTLFGDSTVFGNHDFDDAGNAEAFQVTASISGSLAIVNVYVDAGSAATALAVGVYADAGGSPGALLGQGSLSSPSAAGWNAVTLTTAVPVTSGTAYWVALLSPFGGGRLNFVDAKTGGKAFNSSSSSLAALPGAWTSSKTTPWTDGPASIYGTTG